MRRVLAPLPIAVLALAVLPGPLAGCSSFKASSSPSRWSGQSSKASSSPSRWSSRSSGGEAASEKPVGQAYERDVRETAATVASEHGGGYEIMRRLGPVAATHGISDWEGDPATYRAIGVGLRDAGVSVGDFEQMSRDISAESEVRSKLLLEGYSSTP